MEYIYSVLVLRGSLRWRRIVASIACAQESFQKEMPVNATVTQNGGIETVSREIARSVKLFAPAKNNTQMKILKTSKISYVNSLHYSSWSPRDCPRLYLAPLVCESYTGMDNLFVQPASSSLIACPGRCPRQVERNTYHCCAA